jgi:hypothetical protein
MTEPEPTAPSKPPPADDSCSVCYFSEEDNGVWRCCYNPPGWQRAVTGYGTTGNTLINWPIVAPDDWCGHGYNILSSSWMNPANGPLA